MHQPGMVANPPCGQLSRKNCVFPCPRQLFQEFGVARQVLPSPVGLNMVLIQRDFSRFPRRRPFICLFIPFTAIGSVPIRAYQVTQLRTDGVHRREAVGAGPVVLEAVPVSSTVFSGFPVDQLIICAINSLLCSL